MKKKLLPRAWRKEFYFKDNDDKYKYKAHLDFWVRFGTWMSSDVVAEIKDKVYILPCLCFHFNHSEVYVEFSWLNFSCCVWYKDWKREDAYREKMIRKSREKRED